MAECTNRHHAHSEADATPLECPCFTRGSDYNLELLVYHINEILNGNDDGEGANREPWGSLRRRLLKLVGDAKR